MQVSGVVAAVLSSALGGTAIGATRFLAATLDPVTIGAIRFCGGFLVLAPLALWRRERWPGRRDWAGTAALGLLFFGLFPILFNAALIYTTAARGALALSTLPLMTVVVGGLLGVERPTIRKTLGVLVAISGVTTALAGSFATAPAGAWRGDLLMMAAAFCMAVYSVLSRGFIARSGAISFTACAMGAGALALILVAAAWGDPEHVLTTDPAQWLAAAYLAVVCGALIFFLWAYALGRTTPTLVSVSVAVNPVTAAIFGLVLLGEAIGTRLIVGLLAVLCGIFIAQSRPSTKPSRLPARVQS